MNIGNKAKLVISIAVPQAVGLLGAFFTVTSVETWYQTLEKPLLTPPDWVFGPVWTLLYLLMGISAYLVWRLPKKTKRTAYAWRFFLLQLFLNGIWSFVFFGAQNLKLGFFVIVAMALAIAATMRVFCKLSRPAALLLAPYLLWVIFAGYLNYGIWALQDPEAVHLFAAFVAAMGFVIGLGAVTVIDMLGYLGQRSSYWTEATIRTHKVTKILIWLGTALMLFGGLMLYREEGWSMVSGAHAFLATILVVNGSFLTFKVSPFLLAREKAGKAKKILPRTWQHAIFISFLISFTCWWSALYLFIWHLVTT